MVTKLHCYCFSLSLAQLTELHLKTKNHPEVVNRKTAQVQKMSSTLHIFLALVSPQR